MVLWWFYGAEELTNSLKFTEYWTQKLTVIIPRKNTKVFWINNLFVTKIIVFQMIGNLSILREPILEEG